MSQSDSQSAAPTIAWVPEPALGGLFILHLDGKPTTATALVDRGASRRDQMEALAHLDWAPPLQMKQIFEATMQDRMPEPSTEALPDGRHLSPLFANIAAICDGDEDASDHPVRRYLFPDVNRGGALALDPGEQVLASWQSRPPIVLMRGTDGAVKTDWSTNVPSELRYPLALLTTKRLACIGHLHLPVAARGDHSMVLSLVSPTLDNLRATFRQVNRLRTQPNLFWGLHIRHEWVSLVGQGFILDHKGPLIDRNERSDFVAGGFVYPSGATGILHLRPRKGQPPADQLAAQFLAAVQADQPHVSVTGSEKYTRSVPGLGFTSRKETEETTIWRISGTVPRSLPARF